MLLTKEWLAGEEMKEMTFLLLGPVNRVKNKRQPPFQTTQTQPALLRSGGQEPGLPAGGSWREGRLGVLAACGFLGPLAGSQFSCPVS